MQAYQASEFGAAQGKDQENLFGFNLSYGSQSSKSEQRQTANQSQGSTLTAGNNLNIHATDTGINVQGSQVEKQTGKKVSADAVESIVSSKSTSGAENAANASKLNTQLSAHEIANGHAFEKHVLQRGEFDALGIRTRAQFEQHIENVINNPMDVRYYNDGRVVYLDSTTRTVVIRNPGKGESTAFRPDYDIGLDKYIKLLPNQNTPPIR